MTSFQKAAALAAIQVLFAGCSAGNGDTNKGTSSGTPPAPAPMSVPTITAQPAAETIAPGATATFSVTATGGSDFYQWMKNGAPISGATSSTYTTPALVATDDGATISVTVYNSAGRTTSNVATLHVSTAPAPVAPSITAQPADASVRNGGTATFSVTATGPGLTYQWSRNGAAITGATSASFTTPAVTWQDNASTYQVVVKNTAGSVPSLTKTLTLALSPDQAVYEASALNGGLYVTSWNLPEATGHPETSGSNFLRSDYAALAASPLTAGPQVITESPTVKLTQHLTAVPATPVRFLKNGALIMVPADGFQFAVSYVGSNVLVDELASDGKTVASSRLRNNFLAIPLQGALHDASLDVQAYFDPIFSNADVLDTTTQWLAGATAYSYDESVVGDTYEVFDCEAATTGATPSACTTASTSLTDMLTAGYTSNTDGRVYHLADGSTTVVGGITIWVATAARPQTSVGEGTVEHRIYFQLGNSIYTGIRLLDGETIAHGGYPMGTTTVYPTIVMRMNKAANDSIAAGTKL